MTRCVGKRHLRGQRCRTAREPGCKSPTGFDPKQLQQRRESTAAAAADLGESKLEAADAA
ncbi:MAG TPA: hypothetical protein VFD47_11720 [Actinomycetota bacterium]|nr:hypothetical protein [Actinomycetota bacterium]